MGHEYVKESETFNVNRNGTVPKPTQAEVEAGKVLKADGTWGEGGGGGTGDVEDVYVNGESVLDDEDKIAKITSYKEVTQSEYNALPASKNSDNVLYCIKDAPSSPEGFPPLIYSFEEREIGVWTDGKPLYEKTWKYTFTSAVSGSTSGEYVDLISLPDVEVKNIRATNGSGGTLYPFTSYSGSRGVQLVNFRYLSGYIKLFDLGTPYSVGETIYITAQYTKNTDTPGSGHWGTNGAPAKHYSTNEQVIGTWIDGKPIYERCFYINTYPNQLASNWLQQYNVKSIKFGYIHPWDGSVEQISHDFTFNTTNKTWTSSCNRWTDFIYLQYTKTTD